MSSASLWVTFGTFIQYKDGKAKTGTAVDAGNYRVSCRVAEDKMIKVVWFSYRTAMSMTLAS